MNAQTYVYDGCFACGAYNLGEESGSIISNDNSNIIIFQNLYIGEPSIGKIDSTGTEIWEKSYSSSFHDTSYYISPYETYITIPISFSFLSKYQNNGYYMVGTYSIDTNVEDELNYSQQVYYSSTAHIILSNITSDGSLKWTKGFEQNPNFNLSGMNFNQYSSNLIVYGDGDDNNGICVIDFDTTGSSNWSISIPTIKRISSCLSLADGNFLLNAIDSNKIIVFELDTSGNILNSNSYAFSHILSNTQLLSFKNNHILAAEDVSNSGECYLIFCDSASQVIHANKIELDSLYLNEILEWENNYLNLITTRNDSIFTVNIDTTGSLISIQYSGYLSSFYSPSDGSYGYATWLNEAITNKQGILLLEGEDGNEYHDEYNWDATPISQLDSTGRGCSYNKTINQTLQITPFSIAPTPVTLPSVISQITLWNDSLIYTPQTPSFNESCGGLVNITNPSQENQIVILYPKSCR